MSRKSSVVVCVLFLMTLAVVAEARTIAVDCSNPKQSINRALRRGWFARTLVIEVTGICYENVKIERDNVTIRGTSGDPTLDGIHGVNADPSPMAVLSIWHARDVKLEAISVSGAPGWDPAGNRLGPHIGLGSWGAFELEIYDCLVDNNYGHGAHFSIHTNVLAERCTFSNNELGIRVQRTTRLRCFGCAMLDNETYGLSVGEGANAHVRPYRIDPASTAPPDVPSVISGNTRGVATDFGSVLLFETDISLVPITNPNGDFFSAALSASNSGTIWMSGGTLIGPFKMRSKAIATLLNVHQPSAPPGVSASNLIGTDSQLSVSGNVADIGIETLIREFSSTIFESFATVSGSLTCVSAGDAYKDSSVTVTGTVNGCASWAP
ncbi:MAG: hypothetical protein GY906_39755 [bacterium]|nr:hypothetical protein [bacterium]